MKTPTNAASDGLQFTITEDGQRLVAVYSPGGRRIDGNRLRHAIAANGYSDWFLFNDALLKLIEAYNSAKEPGSVVIGEKRDAEAKIEISRDKMTAFLHVQPPFGGGQPVTQQQIEDALKDTGIRSGIDADAISEAVAAGMVERFVVARGQAPVDGDSTRFVSILPDVKERRPRIDDTGEVDYRDLGELQVVQPGERLMKRIPATAGVPGTNVLGDHVSAKAGKDISYARSLSGVKRAVDDIDVLVAEIYGQPIVVEWGMIVDPTLVLEKVDLSTGNINFDGTVKVKGNINSGMKVVANGDVYVSGLVEAASIKAAGDIVVSGGVIGHGDLRDENEKVTRTAAVLHAKGSVSANFIENAQVYAKGDILVKEMVMHSDLKAGAKVIVGNAGARKGSVIGGSIYAYAAIKVMRLGSPLGIATKVNVGDCEELERRRNKSLLQLEEVKAKHADVRRVLEKVQASGKRVDEKILKKAQLTIESLHQEMMRLQNEIKYVEQQLEVALKGRVIVGAKAYGNVHVTINGKYKCNKDERGAGAFHLENGDMVFGWSKRDKMK